MKPSLITLILILVFNSCSTPVAEQAKQLNGYWEIEKVELPSGETKTYGINRTVDYIELKNDTSGIRTKLSPKIDGSFISNNNYEIFSLINKEGKLYMIYNTPFSKWEEEILKVDKDQLIVINTEKLKYFYKRYQKLSID